MSVGVAETLASLLPPVQKFNYINLTHVLKLTIVKIHASSDNSSALSTSYVLGTVLSF